MKQMIASWSMVMVHGLMAAGPGFEPNLASKSVRPICVWWFFAILATLCLVAWTLMDLRSKPPARR